MDAECCKIAVNENACKHTGDNLPFVSVLYLRAASAQRPVCKTNESNWKILSCLQSLCKGKQYGEMTNADL